MKLLVTNDDGIHAPGLLALKQELSRLGEVFVVAPDRPRSATGHSITLHKPLRVTRVKLADGSFGWASNGTPSDCVVLGISDLLTCHPDFVISGINPGANLGEDLTYSGTVSAAMEGTLFGIPSFSISVASEEVEDYGPAARFAVRLTRALAAHTLPPYSFLNVNVPALPEKAIQGVIITRQARRRYKSGLEKRIDPRGQAYYWLGGELLNEDSPAGTDVEAVGQKYISVTPIHLDLTQHELLHQMQQWEI